MFFRRGVIRGGMGRRILVRVEGGGGAERFGGWMGRGRVVDVKVIRAEMAKSTYLVIHITSRSKSKIVISIIFLQISAMQLLYIS